MEEEKKKSDITNHFEAGANCQVFNGPISGCVFAMPGSNITQNPVQPSTELDEQQQEMHATETINMQSTQNQTVINDLWELIDKGEWMNGVSAESIKEMMTRVLEHSEAMWKLLGNGRSDRIRVTWQNLIGYFSDKGLLPNTNRMGSPALNRMFFADNSKYPGIGSDSDTSYSNIDKGRPSRDNMSAGFRDVLPLLDEYLPKLDKKA